MEQRTFGSCPKSRWIHRAVRAPRARAAQRCIPALVTLLLSEGSISFPTQLCFSALISQTIATHKGKGTARMPSVWNGARRGHKADLQWCGWFCVRAKRRRCSLPEAGSEVVAQISHRTARCWDEAVPSSSSRRVQRTRCPITSGSHKAAVGWLGQEPGSEGGCVGTGSRGASPAAEAARSCTGGLPSVSGRDPQLIPISTRLCPRAHPCSFGAQVRSPHERWCIQIYGPTRGWWWGHRAERTHLQHLHGTVLQSRIFHCHQPRGATGSAATFPRIITTWHPKAALAGQDINSTLSARSVIYDWWCSDEDALLALQPQHTWLQLFPSSSSPSLLLPPPRNDAQQTCSSNICNARAGGSDLLPRLTDWYLMQSAFLPVIKQRFIRAAFSPAGCIQK